MPINLCDAHRQWIKRPPDERFKTLQATLEFTGRRKRNALEETHALRDLRLHATHGGGMFLNGHIPHAALTNWSFSQLCQSVRAPAGYLRTLSAGMAVQCLEYGMAKAGGEAKLLLRKNEGSGTDESIFSNAVSAFTSTTYGRIWDYDVVSELLEAVKDSSWHVPPSRSAEPAGLYASDRDMFIFLVSDETPVEVGNAILGRGFFIWNSETGASTFGLTTFLYNYICGNHIVWGAEDICELKIVHRNKAINRFYKDAVPTLNRFVESRTVGTTIRDAIENAMTVKIGDSLPDVFKTFESKAFSKREINEAWNQGQAEGEDHSTLWGMVQGLTAYARTLDHIDVRVDLERRAGGLLTSMAA